MFWRFQPTTPVKFLINYSVANGYIFPIHNFTSASIINKFLYNKIYFIILY